jgi:hypothetical protein
VGTSASTFFPLTRNFIFLFIAVPFSSFHRSEFLYRPGMALGLPI